MDGNDDDVGGNEDRDVDDNDENNVDGNDEDDVDGDGSEFETNRERKQKTILMIIKKRMITKTMRE